ncbi:MAG: PspC domain-containing protein [Myxococcota bacterium]
MSFSVDYDNNVAYEYTLLRILRLELAMNTSRMNQTHLFRAADGHIAGVCAGLGQRFGVPPTLLRIIWLVAAIFYGTGILLYAVLWWILPRQNALPVEPGLWERRPDGSRRPPCARTAQDRKFLGVCGGIARRYQIDTSLVRLGALSLFTLSGGLALVVYLAAAICMPGPDPTWRQSHPMEF